MGVAEKVALRAMFPALADVVLTQKWQELKQPWRDLVVSLWGGSVRVCWGPQMSGVHHFPTPALAAPTPAPPLCAHTPHPPPHSGSSEHDCLQAADGE